MKKLLVFITAAFFLMTGCNDKKNNAADKMTAADSIKQANLVYTKQLVDLKGTRNIADLLCQGWELEDDLDAITNNSSSMGILPFRSFYFAADFTFVKNPRNAIQFGHWVYNDAAKTITLNYQDGGKDVYKIAAISATELIVINSGIESITKLKFVSKGKRYGNKTEDPYYTSNNEWRQAPKKTESDSLIRRRLKDCLHFYILYYRDNLAKEDKVISFYGFPTCLKWYAGGIFMVKQSELTDNWFQCFYNKDQAMKAYKMMEGIVGKKYKWPKENMGWVKKNLLVLEQMQDKL